MRTSQLQKFLDLVLLDSRGGSFKALLLNSICRQNQGSCNGSAQSSLLKLFIFLIRGLGMIPEFLIFLVSPVHDDVSHFLIQDLLYFFLSFKRIESPGIISKPTNLTCSAIFLRNSAFWASIVVQLVTNLVLKSATTPAGFQNNTERGTDRRK